MRKRYDVLALGELPLHLFRMHLTVKGALLSAPEEREVLDLLAERVNLLEAFYASGSWSST